MEYDVKISLIIAIYNEEKYLADLMTSLANQRYNGSWELILVNNRCTDDSMKIAKDYSTHFRNIKLIDALRKQGKPYALNQGIQMASGEALLFTDAHCVVAPDWLKKMAAALSEYDFVAGGLDVQKLNKDAPKRTPTFTGSQRKFLGFLPYCSGANMGIRMRALKAIGGFCETAIIGQDAEISFRLQLAGYTLHDQPDAVVYVRYRETVDGLIRQTYKYGFAHAFLYKKYRSHGMKKRKKSDILKGYYEIAKHILTWMSKTPKEKQLCLRTMAANWGRIRGSIHHRVLYL